jgi:replicative DNA helicase
MTSMMLEPTSTSGPTRTASAVLADLGERRLRGSGMLRTGFEPLDTALGGGLRTRELTVVGGVPGVGKTAMTLQWARNLAVAGETVVYACYEHDQEDLLARLLLLEVGELVEGSSSSSLSTRDAIRAVSGGRRRLSDEVSGNLLLRAARSRVDDYGERLHLVRATLADTDLSTLAGLVASIGEASSLFVDYLQKVPHHGRDDEERATGVASGLKDVALTHGVGVIATVAGDRSVLEVRRARLHHLRGASGIGYEADVVVMLNDKHRAVSKLHSTHDPIRSEGFKQTIVVSVEKNRQGAAFIDVEFDKDFAHFRLDPEGRHVEERLIDDLLYLE